MNPFEEEYKVFEMFKKNWALASAGNINHYNSCTIGWGSLGTLWTRSNNQGQILTVYLYPTRYTTEFFLTNDYFTVSFFPERQKKALVYMGRHTGKEEDKAKNANLTPIPMQDSVTFEEAEYTFLCKKLYSQQLIKENIAQEIQEYYQSNPVVYPVDENGEWQPHYMFIGEIIDILDKR